MGSNKISTIDLEEPVVEALNTIDTVAEQITTVDANVDSIKGTVENNATGIANNSTAISSVKTTVESNSTKLDNINTSLGTVNTNVNNLNSRLTDTRAANLDLLSNSTYGLSALKTAISSIEGKVGGATVPTVSSTASGIVYSSSTYSKSGKGRIYINIKYAAGGSYYVKVDGKSLIDFTYSSTNSNFVYPTSFDIEFSTSIYLKATADYTYGITYMVVFYS